VGAKTTAHTTFLGDLPFLLRQIPLPTPTLTLWHLLSKEFVILAVVSFCIAAPPIAYFIMHNWLQNYAYWSPIPWWAFLGKGIGSMIIVLITVSAQAFKVAVSSPVKSLRTE
jgi:hypothetical protein